MTPEAIDSLRIVLDPAGQIGIALALVTIMLGVALGLRLSDFAFLKSARGQFIGGAAAQLIGLPLATLALILLISPMPSIALGMIVVACCPGGSSSNLLTMAARGNVAYSVSLTAASSIVAAIFTPLSILFWSGLYAPTADLLRSLDVHPMAFLGQTAVLLGAPLIIGMSIAAKFPAFAAKAKKPVSIAGALLLALAIIKGLFAFVPILFAALPLILPIAIIHNALAFGVGLGASLAMSLAQPTRRALVFEVGIQNSGLALVILLGQLQGLGGAAAIAAVWGVWHLVAGSAIVWFYRWRDRNNAAREETRR